MEQAAELNSQEILFIGWTNILKLCFLAKWENIFNAVHMIWLKTTGSGGFKIPNFMDL